MINGNGNGNGVMVRPSTDVCRPVYLQPVTINDTVSLQSWPVLRTRTTYSFDIWKVE
jgi:hypothetical protein